MEQIACHEELIGFDTIIAKANELVGCCDDMSACCDVLSQGDVIRAIMVTDVNGKNRVYMTDDGTPPVQVPFIHASPIETWLNTEKMKQIFFMGNDLFELYLNGVVVFRKVLELELPQYTTEINLRKFIDDRNPDELTVIEVTNKLIQPVLNTYDLTGLEVTLMDYGEFQGFSPGGTGMILQSPMKLIGTGWIRGAGGKGGNGTGFSAGNIVNPVGVWEGRGSYDDPRHSCTYDACICDMVCQSGYKAGATPPSWASPSQGGYHNYTNRFWKNNVNSPYSGAWVMSGGPHGQEYWNVTSRAAGQAPLWGDQGPCHFNTSGFWCRYSGSGTTLQISVKKNISVSGGSAGVGGAGLGFRQTQDAGWSRGTDGYYSGPSVAHNPSTGKNLSLPAAGDLRGEDGGHGSTWATKGGDSEFGTNDGTPAGKAVVGARFLTADSVALVEGVNVNGAVEQ